MYFSGQGVLCLENHPISIASHYQESKVSFCFLTPLQASSGNIDLVLFKHFERDIHAPSPNGCASTKYATMNMRLISTSTRTLSVAPVPHNFFLVAWCLGGEGQGQVKRRKGRDDALLSLNGAVDALGLESRKRRVWNQPGMTSTLLAESFSPQ